MKNKIRNIIFNFICRFIPELKLFRKNIHWESYENEFIESSINGEYIKLFPPYKIRKTFINNYTYISQNSLISVTEIGKFCSIGPNLVCGIGNHPTNGISTAPMFYLSYNKSNGLTISPDDKFEENKRVVIKNDVFIGANVTILNGVTIGNGAVIGAGAVVNRDIPDFAVAVGNPIKIAKYRFSENQIEKIKKIEWWNFSFDQLQYLENNFYDIDKIINHFS